MKNHWTWPSFSRGPLDGRHPEIEKQALTKIAAALKKGGNFIDASNRLREISLDENR